MCSDLSRCMACIVEDVQAETERETISRVVAWLRERADERHGSAGQLWSADIANRLERGDWRGEP